MGHFLTFFWLQEFDVKILVKGILENMDVAQHLEVEKVFAFVWKIIVQHMHFFGDDLEILGEDSQFSICQLKKGRRTLIYRKWNEVFCFLENIY